MTSQDERVPSAPPERGNHIYTAIQSLQFSATRNVPGFVYLDISVSLGSNGMPTATTTVSNYTSWVYGSDANAFDPVVMADSRGNVTAIFSYADNERSPSAVYLTLVPNTDSGLFAAMSTTPLKAVTGRSCQLDGCDWGDYPSSSTDGTNNWFENPFTNSSSTWSTQIAEVNVP